MLLLPMAIGAILDVSPKGTRWNPKEVRLRTTLVGGLPALYGAAFSPDERRLAISRSDGVIRIFSTTTWDVVQKLRACEGSPKGIAFSPDGRTLAVGAYKEVHLFETAGWTKAKSLEGHEADVYRLAWSPDGSRLASSGGDRTARIWDVEKGIEERVLRGHSEYVMGLAWTPDRRHLVTGSRDSKIIFWNWRTGREVRRLSGPPIDSLAIRRDGRRMLATSGFTALEWNLDFDAPDRTFKGENGPSEAAYTPDGRHILWSSGQVLNVLDSDGKEMARLEGHVARYIHGLVVSPTGRWIVSLGHDRNLCVWGR